MVVLLLFADLFGSKRRTARNFGWRGALIPGTSQAGTTMTAAFALGSEQWAAARFWLLLSVPVSLAVGVLAGLELGTAAGPVHWPVFTTGVLVAAVSW